MCCCDMMQIHLKEKTIYYTPEFREYGIPFRDGGSSMITIQYCPWCSYKLPDSLREQWFELLWSKGLDTDDYDAIPDDMKSDLWWKNNNM